MNPEPSFLSMKDSHLTMSLGSQSPWWNLTAPSSLMDPARPGCTHRELPPWRIPLHSQRLKATCDCKGPQNRAGFIAILLWVLVMPLFSSSGCQRRQTGWEHDAATASRLPGTPPFCAKMYKPFFSKAVNCLQCYLHPNLDINDYFPQL